MIKVIMFVLGLILLNKLIGSSIYNDIYDEEIIKELTIIK